MRTLLEKASASRHGFDDIHLLRGSVDFSGLMDAYRSCLGASAKAAEIARVALDAIEAYLAGPQSLAELSRCMLSCGMPRASKAFPKEQVALLKAEAADTFINAYLACGGDALDELLGLARAVFDEYEVLKAERSALDNNDLLRRTYEALRDHEEIRRAYAGKFAMVMIDEFQDTDQQQVDLIGFLTGEGGRALCTVGDAQQSIYRFRGAEVEVFRRAERRIAVGADDAGAGAAEAGSVVKLVKNFRSHAEILEYVARIFDDGQGGIMPSFLTCCRMTAGRTVWRSRARRADRRCWWQAAPPRSARARRRRPSRGGSGPLPTRVSRWAEWYCCLAACPGRASMPTPCASRGSTA